MLPALAGGSARVAARETRSAGPRSALEALAEADSGAPALLELSSSARASVSTDPSGDSGQITAKRDGESWATVSDSRTRSVMRPRPCVASRLPSRSPPGAALLQLEQQQPERAVVPDRAGPLARATARRRPGSSRRFRDRPTHCARAAPATHPQQPQCDRDQRQARRAPPHHRRDLLDEVEDGRDAAAVPLGRGRAAAAVEPVRLPPRRARRRAARPVPAAEARRRPPDRRSARAGAEWPVTIREWSSVGRPEPTRAHRAAAPGQAGSPTALSLGRGPQAEVDPGGPAPTATPRYAGVDPTSAWGPVARRRRRSALRSRDAGRDCADELPRYGGGRAGRDGRAVRSTVLRD